ncbi:hypothetical protein, partial [Ruminococcus sp.]|uniref:hypothetical protein n=1 Tax=Ruminococcus sp. TaxID=41978 RepID=UPI003FD765E6
YALIGLSQTTRLTGGFDFKKRLTSREKYAIIKKPLAWRSQNTPVCLRQRVFVKGRCQELCTQ